MELKCLRTDPGDGEHLARRFFVACERLGYSAEQALRIALREIPLPRDVARATIAKSLSHVRKALRKASEQIAATRRELQRPNALGLVIVANENNLGLTPAQLMHFMFIELGAMKADRVDGIVYMTPNFYHGGQDGLARSLWLTGYRCAGTGLTDFVDQLGAAWCQYREEMDDTLSPSQRIHEPHLREFDVLPSSRALRAHIGKPRAP